MLVPVYDCRRKLSDFVPSESLFDDLAKGNPTPFPRYKNEIPCGSCVLVCYTISTWFNQNPTNGSEPRHEMSCNVVFVVAFSILDLEAVAKRLNF